MISTRSSAARCGAPARFSATTGSSSTSRPTCRCSTSIRCCSSRRCSTSSTMRRSSRPEGTTVRIQGRRDRGFVELRIFDEGEGIPPADLAAHLRQVPSRAPRATGCDRAPGSALPSPAASSKRCTGPSRPPTGPTAAAPSSPSACRCRRNRNWRAPRERKPAEGPDRRRRAADPQAVADGALDTGLRDSRCDQRQDRARPPRREAGPHHSRSRPAGHAGPRPPRRDPRAQRKRADRRAVEPQRRRRQGPRPRPRRRRLSHQAVRHGGAAGAHARGAAPPARGAGRASRLQGRRPHRRSRPPHRQGRRRAR